jgi:predicted nucleic acid-binding protein
LIVDASVWISSLIPQDVFHVLSRDWLAERDHERTPLVLPTLVLPEIAGAVARRLNAPDLGREAARRVQRIKDIRFVQLDHQLAVEAGQIAATYRLRGADSVYVAVAHTLRLPLVTWDRELLARAGAFVQVLQP